MDSRKLAVGLVVLTIGIGVLWYLQKQAAPPQEQEQPTTRPAATRPAEEASTQMADASGVATPPAEPPAAAGEPEPATDGEPDRIERPKEEEPRAAADGVIAWGIPSGPERNVPLGSLDSETGFLLEARVLSLGGGLQTVKLTDYYATVADKELAEELKDHAEYLRRVGKGEGEYKGHYSVLNPISYEGVTHHSLTTSGAKILNAEGEELWRGDLSRRHWMVGPAGPLQEEGREQPSRAITLTCTIYRNVPRAAGPEQWSEYRFVTFHKTFIVRPKDYTIRVLLSVENHTDQKLTVEIDQAGPSGVPKESYREDLRQAVYGNVNLEDQTVQVRHKPVKEMDGWKLGAVHRLGGSDDANPVAWLGVVNQFFGSMVYLRPRQSDRIEATGYRAGFALVAARESEQSRAFLTRVSLPGLSSRPGRGEPVALDLFVGPKKRDMFVDAGAPYFREEYKRLNYISTIDFGSCFCAVDFLVLGMMWLLQWFSVVAMGNYGVAIIFLVVLVRAALHPLMKKQQLSMMKMQKLGPQMEELKKKYADDKDTLNKEMMRFYKQQGATPLLGCLPMFLQMPIWIALWTALRASVELRHAAFLPFWLTDLAAPDTVVDWGTPLPIIGSSLHLLPILLTVAMFLQTKFNPQMSGAATSATATPEQQQQQKMMKYMMPVMMLFIFYSMPSGLNLYIMTSTFAGVGEQYFIRKHMKKKEEEEALRETVVSAPGKAPRAARQKKQKGPFWVKRG